MYADHIVIKGFDITDTDNDSTEGLGIYLAGSHCVIEDNYIYEATRGGITSASNSSDCTIKNNRLYRNAMHGIHVAGTNHLVEGNEIWGTIQYHPKWVPPPSWLDADWPNGISLENAPHCTVKNNIFYDQYWRPIYIEGTSSTGLDSDYNCTYRSDGVIPAGTAQPHDLWGVNPQFVNADASNFHLQSDSPCIDAGISVSGVSNDFDGNPRPQGPGYDIGAFEYQPGGVLGDLNGDGLVNAQDVQACVNHILQTQDWGEAADVNGDGRVDVLDVQRIVNILF